MSLHTWHHQGPCKPSSYPPSHSTLTGAELPQAKKSYIYAHSVTLVVSDSATLWPVACQACQGRFSRQEYWSVLANTGCHTLLKHYISCCHSRQPPEYLVLPEPLRPKQLHHLHTWPSQGQTQALQGSLRSKPQWMSHM